MTTQLNAMKQWLEALEDLRDEQNGAPLWKRQEHWQAAMQKANAAITSLRTAIEQAEKQEPVAYEYCDDVFWHDSPDINDYIRANGKALVYTTPPNVATPLAAQRQSAPDPKDRRSAWVGLTDEEVDQFEIWYDEEEERKGWVEPKLIAQYFEAKLKEKNT